MKLALSAAPVIEPISIAELKLHCRIDETTVEDVLLTDLVLSARATVEDMTSRKLLTQTWDYSIDEWPDANYIKIPFGKLQSITSIKWKDTEGTETTLALTTDYLVETNGDGIGRVVLPYGETWPSGTLYPSKPITIKFVCGWTTAALVPYQIKAAVKMIAADLYTNREGQVFGMSGMTYQENVAVKRLLASYRLRDEF